MILFLIFILLKSILSKDLISKHAFSLGTTLQMEQEDSIIAKKSSVQTEERGASKLCWQEKGFQALGRELPTPSSGFDLHGSIRTTYYL